MDIGDFLLSINKISFVTLLIISGFILYQIYLLKKEAENKKKKVVIPDFKSSNFNFSSQSKQMFLPEEKKINYHKSSKIPIVIAVILFFIVGSIFIFGILSPKSNDNINDQDLTTQQRVNFVASKGIKIYNQNWEEISDEMLGKMSDGQRILIGIESVKGADIDMARIRVNKDKWDYNDITTNFNDKMNVFFKEYIISTGESFLKIEAQLHSKTDGWLGD